MNYWQYIIIVIVLIIILFAVIKATKKDAGLDFNKLVEYLGGKDNIISTETNVSRFKVELKDVSKANKEGIQKLGAKGIVEIDNQLKIILGPNAKTLEKYIDHVHTIDGIPFKVPTDLQHEILIMFKNMIGLKKRGTNLFFSDIDKLKEKMIKELN